MLIRSTSHLFFYFLEGKSGMTSRLNSSHSVKSNQGCEQNSIPSMSRSPGKIGDIHITQGMLIVQFDCFLFHFIQLSCKSPVGDLLVYFSHFFPFWLIMVRTLPLFRIFLLFQRFVRSMRYGMWWRIGVWFRRRSISLGPRMDYGMLCTFWRFIFFIGFCFEWRSSVGSWCRRGRGRMWTFRSSRSKQWSNFTLPEKGYLFLGEGAFDTIMVIT